MSAFGMVDQILHYDVPNLLMRRLAAVAEDFRIEIRMGAA